MSFTSTELKNKRESLERCVAILENRKKRGITDKSSIAFIDNEFRVVKFGLIRHSSKPDKLIRMIKKSLA